MTLIYILYPFLFSIIPILYLYKENILEVSTKILYITILIMTIFYIILYYLLIKLFPIYFSSIIMFNLFIYIYNIKKIIWKSIIEPIKKIGRVSFFHWLYYSLILVFTYFSLFYKFNYNIISIFSKIMFGIFTFTNIVIIFNIVSNIKKLNSSKEELNNNDIKLENNNINKKNTYPNIYYIISDSYPGQKTLKKYCNLENYDFLNYLKDHNFNIYNDALSNYRSTMISIPSTLNMDYLSNTCNRLNDINYNPHIKKIWDNNQLFQYLSKRGYKIIELLSQWGRDQEFNTPSTKISMGKNSYSFFEVLLEDGIFSPIIKYLNALQLIKETENIEKFFVNMKIKDEPTFIFAHFLLPHPRFLFKKNLKPKISKLLIKTKVENEKIEDLVNQIEYVNKLLKNIIDNILIKDKDSIIILQSDHGIHMYNFSFVKKIHSLNFDETQYNILKAIYYKGEKIDINTRTSVNTFRELINLIFNDKLEMLDEKIYVNYPYEKVGVINSIFEEKNIEELM